MRKDIAVMKEQRNLREMNDRELRSYRRSLRRQRERRRRWKSLTFLLLAVFCMAMVFAASYNTISSSAGNGFKYYTQITVNAEDTLWKIADDYMEESVYRDKNHYIEEVRRINHLDEEDVIWAGQKLVVPYYSKDYR